MRPRGRPTSPAISKVAVIDEALTIIDEEGIDALSMRTLAKRLGVQAPSLYNHFGSKEVILDAVARKILDELQARKAEDEPWQDWLAHAMIEYRRILMAHPNAVHLMTRVPLASFISDATFEHAVSSGAPPELVLTIAEAAEGLVTGWVLYSVASGREVDTAPDHRLLVEANTFDEDQRFERACYALVNGFLASLVFRAPPASRRKNTNAGARRP